jgi:hypothetical protein
MEERSQARFRPKMGFWTVGCLMRFAVVPCYRRTRFALTGNALKRQSTDQS